MGCGQFAVYVFFAKKEINSGMELTFDYNWELVRRQVGTVCLCGSHNYYGQTEKREKGGKKVR